MLGGVPVATLKRWRTQRSGPLVLHIGRHVRYRRSAVETWLSEKDREAADWMAS
ncbi:helix-turn-helix protein [Nocardioides sp. J9]|nr:helix-turn-helix protein [Nocardioides sp. J9]